MKTTTVKFRLRASFCTPGWGKLVLCATRHRLTRTITIPCSLSLEEWDEKSQQVLISKGASQKQKKRLNAISRQLQEVQKETKGIISVLEEQGDYTATDVIGYFRRKQQGVLFCDYVFGIVKSLEINGQFGTARAYDCAARSFLRFLKGNDIRLEKITSRLMEDYQQFLLNSGCMKNTVSCYMRSLRAAYNSAIREKLMEEKKGNPFSNVFTGNAPTQKRAIGKESIIRIASVGAEFVRPDTDTIIHPATNPPSSEDVSSEGGQTPPRRESIQFSCDLFLFSFYTQGMSFVDMVNLKKENIKSGKIQYYRKKTGQLIIIELEDCMKEIIDRYKRNDSKYIFPVLKEVKGNNQKLPEVTGSHQKSSEVKGSISLEQWKKTRSALATYNYQLKKLATLAGIEEKLTSYVSRHSWATMAAQEGIPVSTISRGMGHESEKTTRIYIGRLDYSDVGEANRRILARFVDKIPENHPGSGINNSM